VSIAIVLVFRDNQSLIVKSNHLCGAYEGLMVSARRWIELWAAAVLLATSAVWVTRADGQSGPRLQLGQREWDFGQIWTGDPCKTEVELKNVGDAPLKILNVKSSCGCTAAKPSKRELAPGESDTMTVTYDTNKNAKQVRHTVTIVTNDPAEPEVKFEVHGEVWNVFDAKPYAVLGFGRVKPTSRRGKAIELTNNLPEKVYPKLRPIDADVPFEITLDEIEPGMKYRLYARIRPPLKLGDNRVNAVIETGVERLPTMSINVNARAMERVSVWPERLRVVPSQKAAGSRTLRINYEREQPVDVTQILCDLPSVTVEKLAPQPPSAYSEFAELPLRIFVPAFDAFPDEGAVLEIHTNDPDPKFQKFVVPIEKVDPRKHSAPEGDEEE
jgi:hypothetical protein